jgi:hypothetical protein
MGVLSGIALFGVYLLSEVLIYFYPRKFSDGKITPLSKKYLLLLFLIFIISLITLLINPHGFETYSYTFSHLQLKVMAEINEWLSPFHQIFLGRFNNIIYIFYLLGAVPILYYSFRKKDLFISLLTIVFAVYSTRNVRFTVDYLLIIFVFYALAANYLFTRINSEKIKDFFLQGYQLKIVLIAVLIFFIVNLFNDKLYLMLGYIRATGKGIDGYFYPVKMFEFIEKNKIHEIGERPFNSFENGGYFIWTFYGKKNFIDSRNLNDKIIDDFKLIEMKMPGFRQKLNELKIDYIPWSYPDIVMRPQFMQATLVSYLVNRQDEWKLIFWDDNSFLFVKNEDKFKDLISKYEYRFVNPYNFIFQRKIIDDALQNNPDKVKEEIIGKFREDPTGTFIKAIYNAFYKKIN